MTALSPRDRTIVRLISSFKLLTSNHINELVFTSTTSRTPADRALRRLVAEGYLIRIERRLVGGDRGGSGQYVYGLGRRGFFLHHDGRYNPIRTVQFHTLAIADTFVAFKRLERAGQLRIVGFSTEPDCWMTVGTLELKPDLLVEIERPSGVRNRAMYEIDMGTEGQKQLRGKLEAVVRAWHGAGEAGWTSFPPTAWIVVDAERETELKWLIEQLPEDARNLFRVCQLSGLPAVLGVSYPQ